LPSGGARTGLRDLDEILLGLNDKDFIIVAARPSVGKTALLLDLAYGATTQNNDRDALFFSLEMGRDQISQRMLAKMSHMDTMRIRTQRMTDAEDKQYVTMLGEFAYLPFFVNETPGAGVAYIREQILRHQAERDRKAVVFVDYAQLMVDQRHKDRLQEMSAVSRSIKALAKELDCPIVVASQLSRAVEGRTSHVPLLSDLRETGSWEQDADVVMFIYREELYDPETDKRGVAEIHIAKHRNGPVGVVPMRFDKGTTTFSDLTYRAPGGFDEAARKRGML